MMSLPQQRPLGGDLLEPVALGHPVPRRPVPAVKRGLSAKRPHLPPALSAST